MNLSYIQRSTVYLFLGCCIFYKIFALYAGSLVLSSSKLFQSFFSFFIFISQRICIVSLVSLHSFVRGFFLLSIDFFISHFVNFQHRSSPLQNFSIATDKEDVFDDSFCVVDEIISHYKSRTNLFHMP